MNKKLLLLGFIISSLGYANETEIKLDDTVVMSTTGFATDMRKVSANTSVVTSKEIEERGYKSVEEVLEDIPSVALSRDMFGVTVDLRGQGPTMAKRNVQILVDGVAVNSLDTSMSSTPINTVATDSIERIEVIPGGGAVLYGSGTAGGVINIITKDGKGRRGNVGYDFTSFGGHKTDVNLGETFGDFDVDLTYTKDEGKGYRDEDENNSDYLQGKLRYNISSNQNIEFKYARSESKVYGSDYLTKEELEEDRTQSKGDISRVNTVKDDYTLTYNGKVSDKLDFNFIAFHQETNMDTGDKGEKSTSFFDDKKLGVKPKLKYSYGEDNSVVVGLDYIDNDAKRLSNGMATTKNSFNKETLGGFIMNNYKVGKFELNQGIRYEESNYDITRSSDIPMMDSSKKISTSSSESNMAYELSGNYSYSDTGVIYTRLEKGFTSPPPSLLTDTVPQESGESKYLLNDLKSETYHGLELGFRDFLGNTSINATVFYTLTNDEIYTKMKGMGQNMKVHNYNIDETERFGAEIKLEQYLGKLTLSQAYQYVSAEIKDGVEKGYLDNGSISEGIDLSGRKISNVPNHKFTLGANYEATSKLDINGEVVYTGSSYVDNTNLGGKENGYTVANLRFNYNADNGVSLQAGINNVFDKEYNDAVDYSSSNGEYLYNPAAGRNFYLGFGYTF